nr:putative ribonuclease H-like domain-containing protein [Tanacetum cinerariifolium]
ESVFEENIKLLNIEVQLRDTALVTLSQTNKKTGLGYNSQVFTKAMFDCENYYSSESDCEPWPPSNLYDRFQPSGGYHAVPPLYTGTFMPPKPDLVFNTAPIPVETDQLAFNVQLSPTKPEQDLSHTSRPSAPIIEDPVFESEEESEPKEPHQSVPSFAQSFEHVKPPRHSVQPIETTFQAATPVPASPKSNSSGKRRNTKACFVCKSVDHLIKDCDFYAKKMAKLAQRNYANRGYHKQYAPKPLKHSIPTVVLTQSKPVSNTAVRPVSAVLPYIPVTHPRHANPVVTKSKSPIQRKLIRNPSSRTSNSPPRVIVVQVPVVSAAQGKQGTWVLNGGYVAFGGNPKGGKSTGKGKIKTGKLDFDNVYFVKKLKFNHFSVSQMCDKKNIVLFTDTECLFLSSDFKLPDKSQVLLRVPRENNMYNVNLKNIVPSGDLTCLFAKATLDESNLWHRRLAHVNFKTFNKLVKGSLVRGLPTKFFENDNTCVACKKGKQHKASCKTKPISSIDQPLFRLHMDLFGPTFVKSLNKKSYRLVITDDYNRFTWVFFLASKDETSPILKTFIAGLENQLSLIVKVIRSDNGTEFKNFDINQFCGLKGIKREFSVPRTPQQNGIAERKHKTLIKAARTMLTDSLLLIPFWAEAAVNTACYVQNRVLVTKPHNKTPYDLLHGRSPSIGFMRPFGYPVTILNTLDHLGKFQGKVDERFLVGYSVCSKAFRVFNSRTRIIQETLHVNFLENKPNVTGTGPTWLFDIDTLSWTMNYHTVTAGNQTNSGAEDAAFYEKAHDFDVKKPESKVILSPSSSAQSKEQDDKTMKEAKGKSLVEYVTRYKDLNAKFQDCSKNSSNEVPTASTTVPTVGQNSLNNTNTFSAAGLSNIAVSPTYGDASQFPDDPDMPGLEDIIYSDDEDFVGAEADFNNLESSIPVSPIPTTSIHKDHPVSQIIGDLSSTTQTRSMTRAVKDQGGLSQMFGNDFHTCMFACFLSQEEPKRSAFLYGTIEEEVYVCQPPGFEDPDHPNKVYKVVKALYGLHQAPRAWYETLATYFLENDDIIFGATNKDLCRSFEKLMKDKFQMSSMGELIFFLSLQVKQKEDGIFISQDKYVPEILRKFGLTEGKSASTPIDTEKPLLKDPDGEDIDVHIYRLISWQCKKQTVVATSSTKAEYVAAASCCAQIFRYLKGKPHLGLWYPKDSPFDLVAYSDSDYAGASLDRKSTTGGFVATSSTEAEYVAAASCCAQVLWIQNQLLDYGDSPLLRVNIPRSDEDRLKILELTVFVLPQVEWVEIRVTAASLKVTAVRHKLLLFVWLIGAAQLMLLDSSSKLYMYPRFLQLIIQNQLGDLSSHITKYISPALTQKVFANMRRVGKGFSRVETPLFEGMLVIGENIEEGIAAEQVQDDDVVAAAQEGVTAVIEEDVQDQSIPSPTPPPHPPQDLPSTSSVQPTPPTSPQPQPQAADFPFGLLQTTLDTCDALTSKIKPLESAKMSQALEISKLKKRVKRLEKGKKVKVFKLRRLKKVGTSQRIDTSDDTLMEDVSNQGRMIDELDRMKEDDPAEVEEVVEVVTTAKLITEVVVAASKSSKDKGKGIMVEEPKPMKKKQQVEMDEEYARKLHEELNQDIDWDITIDHVKQKAKEDHMCRAKFNTNIEFLLKSKKQIEEEEIKAIESINETPAQKAGKRRKLNEEVAELNKHLEIVPDEDDDVFIEATPLARKLILLVERKYLLSRYTLDQMLNAVRLRVEEQSEMSLELLRFIRQQYQDAS